VAALKKWLQASGITEGPIFRPIRKGGQMLPQRLTAGAVASIVKERIENPAWHTGFLFGASASAGALAFSPNGAGSASPFEPVS
jgi:hypothetical protein